ncbi:MAG: hypothetical protein AB7E08_05740 [Candidatus Omnitrophota bacterium]
MNQKTDTRLKCPYCGGEFKTEVKLIPAYSDTEQYIFEQIMRFACGIEPYKGYVKHVEDKTYVYEFHLQIYDSPQGDTWIKGKAEWVPGHRFKVLEIEYSDY